LLSFTSWDPGSLGVDIDQPPFILCASHTAQDIAGHNVANETRRRESLGISTMTGISFTLGIERVFGY